MQPFRDVSRDRWKPQASCIAIKVASSDKPDTMHCRANTINSRWGVSAGPRTGRQAVREICPRPCGQFAKRILNFGIAQQS